MFETKKISIIIPVYNVKPYLRKCVESVITQQYRNLEIILIDDGSTDGSGEICGEYAKKDLRIIEIHKKNGGLSSARNAGLDIASGDLIAFVDSDDWIGTDVYTKIVETHEKTGADIIQFGYFIVQQGEFMKRKKYTFDFDREFSKKEALSMLLEDKYIENYVWNKIYTRKLFEKERFPLGKNFEDIAIMYKLLLRANKVVVLSEYYKYFYFQRKTSIVNTKKFKNALDWFESYWIRYEALKNNAFINHQALCISTLLAFINIHTDFPFQYAKRAAFFEEKLEMFLAENENLNKYPLNKSHCLYLNLPFPLFLLLYNRFTRIIMNFLKRVVKPKAAKAHNPPPPPVRHFLNHKKSKRLYRILVRKSPQKPSAKTAFKQTESISYKRLLFSSRSMWIALLQRRLAK